MEENNKPKRERIKPTPVAKSPKPKATDKDDKIKELASAGFNINQIGSMLAVHTEYIKSVLR